jgi:hypothetical protein
MLDLLASVIGTVVPERYRKWILRDTAVDLRGAVASGALQLLGCVAALLVRYVAHVQQRPADFAAAAIKAGAEDALANQQVQLGAGVLTLAEYLIQPLTLVLAYFAFEGIVRGTAALVTREIVPTLPLHAVDAVHGKIEAWAHRRVLGPLMADEVQAGDGDAGELEIRTCRQRTWTPSLTIEYQDKQYELVSEAEGEPPRRWIYRLRAAPPTKPFRGVHHYDPEELLQGAVERVKE